MYQPEMFSFTCNDFNREKKLHKQTNLTCMIFLGSMLGMIPQCLAEQLEECGSAGSSFRTELRILLEL